MKNKNAVILVIVGLLLVLISVVALVVANNIGENPYIDKPNKPGNEENINVEKDYLVIEEDDLWSYRNGNFKKLDDFNIEKQKFNIYVNNYYFGKYYLRFIRSWNVYDDNNSFINYEGDILAFTEGLNISLKNYTLSQITYEDLNPINNIIGADIDYNSLTINEKVIVDLDNNGVLDEIVNVSNIDFMENNDGVIFNLIYVVVNGESNILVKDIIDSEDEKKYPSYYLKYLLNINDDNYASIIFYEEYFSLNGEPGNIMYQNKNGIYKKVVSN